MTTNAKFEKWWTDKQHMLVGTLDAQEIWQAALSSLEVTPELAAIASNEFGRARKRGVSQYESMERVLAAVFAAIKEGKA